MNTSRWWRGGIVLFFLIVGVVLLFFANHNFFGGVVRSNEAGTPEESILPDPSSPEVFHSILEGGAARTTFPEYAIGAMIDNIPVARKSQDSLDEASVVFEALAEGGVTRFLAVFSSRINLPRIGPIRSARSYFFDFFKPFHGLFVHAGGSTQVLEELFRQKEVLNVDHASAALKTFWRDTSLAAPHNLFSSSAALWKIQDSSTEKENPGFAILSAPLFPFSKISFSGTPVQNLTLHFSTTDFTEQWVWNAANESFERQQKGTLSEFKTQNLIVLVIPSWPIADDEKGRLDMQDVGSGPLYFLQNGMMQTGTWQKKDRASNFQFLNDAGLPFSFLPGKTWISVVDAGKKIDFPPPNISKTAE